MAKFNVVLNCCMWSYGVDLVVIFVVVMWPIWPSKPTLKDSET